MKPVQPPPLPRRRRTINLVPVVILVSGAVVCLVLVASFLHWRMGAHRAVDEGLAKVRAKGQPVNWTELDHWYPSVPEAENAALVYTQAFAILKSTFKPGQGPYRWGELELPRHSVEMAEPLRREVEEAVQTSAAALEYAHRAAALPRCRYPVDLTEGPGSKLPHLAPLRGLVHLLEFEALVRARAGQRSEAAESVLASLAISRSLLAEPILASQFVSTGVEDSACRGLERTVSCGPLGDDQLSRLSQCLADLESTNRYARGLAGERAMYAGVFVLAQTDPDKLKRLFPEDRADEEEPSAGPLRVMGWRGLGLVERELGFYLGAVETNIVALSLEPPDSITASRRVSNALEKELLRPEHWFSRMFLQGPTGLAKKDAEGRANLRTARTGLAIERWRLSHGNELPESLDVLVPQFLAAVPLDPFDGQPLRFKRLDRGYVVYSIGRDGRDDGGKEKPLRSVKMPAEQRQRYDVTFIVDR
jgi:hypothetical protein